MRATASPQTLARSIVGLHGWETGRVESAPLEKSVVTTRMSSAARVALGSSAKISMRLAANRAASKEWIRIIAM
ncbi:MAG: hypothetical protein U0527_12710 [Candidatus Eisenbacteria bacterium]